MHIWVESAICGSGASCVKLKRHQRGRRVDILKLDPNEEDEYAEDAEIEAEIEEEEAG